MLTPVQEKWAKVKEATHQMVAAGWPEKGQPESPEFAKAHQAWKQAVDDAYALENSLRRPMLKKVRESSTGSLKDYDFDEPDEYIGQNTERMDAVGKELSRRQAKCRECGRAGGHKMDCSKGR